MVINVFVIWTLTVKTFYCSIQKKDDLLEAALSLGFLSRVISVLLNLYIKNIQVERLCKFKTITRVIGLDVLSVIYFIILFAWPENKFI